MFGGADAETISNARGEPKSLSQWLSRAPLYSKGLNMYRQELN